MIKNQLLFQYVETFENLTPENIPELGKLFHETVFFKDPFNEVTGKQATLAIFTHMFATTESPKFTVINSTIQGNVALLYWHFDFVLPSHQTKQAIQGMSRVSFDKNGLVTEHIDHWDAGEQVYSQVPILRWLIKLVRKRLSAPSN